MRDQFEILKPMEIENRSMEIIESEIPYELDEKLAPIIKRVIHTTADFDYLDNLCFSDDAISSALAAIDAGCHIVTDTNMALSGINKPACRKYGCEPICYMADERVAKLAKERGVTRATVSMEEAAKLSGPIIFAVGNAPTALIALYDLLKEGKCKPALIIGVPVGFVNVVEAKELIMTAGVPYIVARGRKGGSNVAAAIVNSLLYYRGR